MDGNHVLFMHTHPTEPYKIRYKSDHRHYEIEPKHCKLVSIQESKAIDECHPTLDQKMGFG